MTDEQWWEFLVRSGESMPLVYRPEARVAQSALRLFRALRVIAEGRYEHEGETWDAGAIAAVVLRGEDLPAWMME